jgi:hypothetical protein
MLFRNARRAVLLGALASGSLTAATAAAQTETPAARADRLFREGKAALEAKRFAEACPKLAESQHLDPGTGTLLALGLCHEGAGATASALAELLDVVTASEKTRPDRAALARQHADAVGLRLSTITVEVRPESRDHAAITLDGTALPPDKWSKYPVDPGDHVLEAKVPNGTPWQKSLHVAPGPNTQVVAVPSLEAAAAAAPPPPVAPTSGGSSRKTIGWIVAGSGAGLVVLGGVFGGLALSEHGSATSACPSSPCSNSSGVSDENQAKTFAWVSDFGVGLGLVGVGVGTYFLLTRGDAPKAASAWMPRVTPTVGPGGGGLSLDGAW